MVTILIIEDELAISRLLRLSLTKAGYHCVCAMDGAEAANILEQNCFDLILLDIMLPEIDGFQLLEYILPMKIPVIFLTAKDSVADRVKGLRAGAEDYIIKPFEIAELLARVDVVLRRYKKTATIIQFGGLTIDTESRQVWKARDEIALTKKEYDLLLFFVQNPNRALYRETIYERVWGDVYQLGSKTVDLHVQRLRKKVGWEECLIAVNKIGYRLETKDEV